MEKSGVGMGKCVGVWKKQPKKRCGKVCWGVWGGKERWGCEKMWERCGKVCWCVGGRCEKVGGVGKYGEGVGKCFGCGVK